jgi:hypothetical protein
MRRGGLGALIAVAYVIVGAFVAASHHYFSHSGNAKGILSAVLAILLWPGVLAGANLHIK